MNEQSWKEWPVSLTTGAVPLPPCHCPWPSDSALYVTPTLCDDKDQTREGRRLVSNFKLIHPLIYNYPPQILTVSSHLLEQKFLQMPEVHPESQCLHRGSLWRRLVVSLLLLRIPTYNIKCTLWMSYCPPGSELPSGEGCESLFLWDPGVGQPTSDGYEGVSLLQMHHTDPFFWKETRVPMGLCISSPDRLIPSGSGSVIWEERFDKVPLIKSYLLGSCPVLGFG